MVIDNISSLPPIYQKQALEKLKVAKKVKPCKSAADNPFDSQLEEDYYNAVVWPLLRKEEIISCELHKEFLLFEKTQYGDITLPKAVYKPDFVLTFKDGSVIVVEVKNKKIRKLQRDYPLRRRIFIEQYCIPKGWVFKEVINEDG
jgi:hypothetical protein